MSEPKMPWLKSLGDMPSPAKRPTTMPSTALYASWKRFPSTRGTAKATRLLAMPPLTISRTRPPPFAFSPLWTICPGKATNAAPALAFPDWMWYTVQGKRRGAP